MSLVERATPADREAIERLVTACITAEGGRPKAERVSWAVEQVLKNRFPGALFVAREKSAVVGVVLAVYTPSAELGRLLVVNDFFVDPAWRRKGALVTVRVMPLIPDAADRSGLILPQCSTCAVAPCTVTCSPTSSCTRPSSDLR